MLRTHGIRAVLFDIGGVFVEDTVSAGLAMLAASGDVSLERLRQYRGRTRRAVDAGEVSEDRFWVDLCQQFNIGSHGGFEIESLIVPIRGTIQILDAVVAAGFTAGILSNDSSSLARAKLAELGITSRFDAVTISAEVSAVKPEPEIYRIAARAVGQEPGQCLFVDDHESNLVTARELGMTVVRFETPVQAAKDLAGELDQPALATLFDASQ